MSASRMLSHGNACDEFIGIISQCQRELPDCQARLSHHSHSNRPSTIWTAGTTNPLSAGTATESSRSFCQKIARGLIGLPTAFENGNGGETNMNSHLLRSLQISERVSRKKFSPTNRPM
jgi:hypothetical protein